MKTLTSKILSTLYSFALRHSPWLRRRAAHRRLQVVVSEAQAAISACLTPQAIDAVEMTYVGRRGEITKMLRLIGGLAPADKPAYVQAVTDESRHLKALIAAGRGPLA